MDAQAAAAMALKHKGTIVGIKTAHYTGPEWTPVEHAVEAGTAAGIPVMVDFGNNHPDTRPLADLLTKKLRPGDIYTHMYSGLRNELVDGKPNPGMIEGRKRGVIFDVGHGGGSFAWRVAMPMVKAGFVPDSISTDLHITSMNAGMKDMLNVMDKCLAMGIPLPKVIAMSTWHPAREIKQDALGHLADRRHRRHRGAAPREGPVRLPRHVRREAVRHGAADRRDDPQGRQDRLRAERAGTSRVDDAARRLHEHGRAHVGRDEEVTWRSRTRRRRRTAERS